MGGWTTYADFWSNLAGLTIAGVTRTYDHPPQSVNEADMPVQFVDFAELPEEMHISFDGGGGWPTYRGRLVVLIGPTVRDTNDANYDACITMLDNMADAFRDNTCALAKSAAMWEMRIRVVTIAGIDYWGVEAFEAADDQ